MVRTKKICVITGTRADYGILKSVLSNIELHPNLYLQLVVAGAHFSKEHGETYKQIEKDGFWISARVAPWKPEYSTAQFFSECIVGFEDAFKHLKPDVVIVLGDRIEMLAAALAANYLNIVVAHIHGGDLSGTWDDSQRHALTKLSHIHFPGTKKSAERIRQMGEPWTNIYITGNPALDVILKEKLYTSVELMKKGFPVNKRPLLILVQHPVTDEVDNSEYQIRETLAAINGLGYNTIAIFPNTDRGYQKIVERLKKKAPNVTVYNNLDHKTYLSLLAIADALVGNSSSGILEAPSLKLPVVNIGDRQAQRERAENVIDTSYGRQDIKLSIRKAVSKKFRKSLKFCKTPYGNGTAGQMIATVLSDLDLSAELLKKRFHEVGNEKHI